MSRPVRIAHVVGSDLSLRFLLFEQLIRLRDEGYDVAGISPPGPWTQELEAQGIRHIPWHNATRSWTPTTDLRAFFELLAIFRREKFDLVHTHFVKQGLMGRVAARLARTPCVLNTVHGFYATPEDRLAKRVPLLVAEAAAARLSHFELYQSEEDLDFARRAHVVPVSRSELLSNGIDLRRFHPDAVVAERVAQLRSEFGIPRGAVVVGIVGRLIANKGYREFFEAARLVHAELPGVRFFAIGDADPDKDHALGREELERASRDVILAGWRDDVRDLLALIDIFVLPSWREGMPRSAIEAAAMGKSLVLTDIRGCREVIRDGKEGFLVPVRDPRRLAEAIGSLARDEDKRRLFGLAARNRAVERFDERKVVEIVAARTRTTLAAKGIASMSEIARAASVS